MFGGGEFALLLVDADDPFAPGVVERVDRLERALAGIPGLDVNSLLSVFRRARAGFEPTPEQVAALRTFVTGTDLLRRQGLVGDHYLAIALTLEVGEPAERHALLAAIDAALRPVEADPGPIRGIHRLGQPCVNAYLDETCRRTPALLRALRGLPRRPDRSSSTARCARSSPSSRRSASASPSRWRTSARTGGHAHDRLADGADDDPRHRDRDPRLPALALRRAAGGAPGRRAPDLRAREQVRRRARRRSSPPPSASRRSSSPRSVPIREMGIWVAVGLAITWVVVFTLFPALQKLLAHADAARAAARARGRLRAPRGGAAALELPLALAARALGDRRSRSPARRRSSACRASLAPMPRAHRPGRVHRPPLRALPRHPRALAAHPGPLGHERLAARAGRHRSEPEVLTGLHRFQQALEADPDVGAAVGPTTILRLIRYLGGEGDAWPEDPPEAGGRSPPTSRRSLPLEPMLAALRAAPRPRRGAGDGHLARRGVRGVRAPRRGHPSATGRTTAARAPRARALLDAHGRPGAALTRTSPQTLVPTLVESFVLTVAIIFAAFLLVFRSGTARLMAMIPSIFAILVMFLVMRLRRA